MQFLLLFAESFPCTPVRGYTALSFDVRTQSYESKAHTALGIARNSHSLCAA